MSSTEPHLQAAHDPSAEARPSGQGGNTAASAPAGMPAPLSRSLAEIRDSMGSLMSKARRLGQESKNVLAGTPSDDR